MKKSLSVLILATVSCFGVVGFGVLLSVHALAQQGLGAQGMSASVIEQIVAIATTKQSFTPAEQKIDSKLVFGAKAASGQLAGTSVAGIASVAGAGLGSYVTVDIYGNVSAALLAAIDSVGGVVVDQSGQWGIVRASLRLGAIETVAANDDVRSIQSAAEAITNVVALTSQGYITHKANQVVKAGIDGTGATVGVLSASASPACVAPLIASGDLPPDTMVLPGQQGIGADEGCAMMEIVHDLAPGANLIFATAFNGVAGFANNILALQAAWRQGNRGRRHLLQ